MNPSAPTSECKDCGGTGEVPSDMTIVGSQPYVPCPCSQATCDTEEDCDRYCPHCSAVNGKHLQSCVHPFLFDKTEIPMGVSEWIAHGRKYGYIDHILTDAAAFKSFIRPSQDEARKMALAVSFDEMLAEVTCEKCGLQKCTNWNVDHEDNDCEDDQCHGVHLVKVEGAASYKTCKICDKPIDKNREQGFCSQAHAVDECTFTRKDMHAAFNPTVLGTPEYPVPKSDGRDGEEESPDKIAEEILKDFTRVNLRKGYGKYVYASHNGALIKRIASAIASQRTQSDLRIREILGRVEKVLISKFLDGWKFTGKVNDFAPILEELRRSLNDGDEVNGDIRELLCQSCNRDYPVWFTDNELWNTTAQAGQQFLCPTCFAMQAEEMGFKTVAWYLTPEEAYKAHRTQSDLRIREVVEAMMETVKRMKIDPEDWHDYEKMSKYDIGYETQKLIIEALNTAINPSLEGR